MFSKAVIICGVLFLVFASFLLAPSVLKAGEPPATGTEAPDFTLTSEAGTPVSLHDLYGKWVVLYFYTKDFSSGCKIEAPNFWSDPAEYKEKHAAILGVSLDSASSHKAFCAKEGLDFKLLSDPTREVSKLYGSLMHYHGAAYPARHTVLINPRGVVAEEFMMVNPVNHSAEVLAALTRHEKHGIVE